MNYAVLQIYKTTKVRLLRSKKQFKKSEQSRV